MIAPGRQRVRPTEIDAMECEDRAQSSVEGSFLPQEWTLHIVAGPAVIHDMGVAGKPIMGLPITGVRSISAEFSKTVQAISTSPSLTCKLSFYDDNFSPQGCPWAY